ncbi:SDR family NAD(P)-dependent oxidoreductase [Promicromonospora sp. AC04]|uniref:SDR family NAD(P)-dependent oxidoreductase n=1 Tax=Promicromonospora sp. AC04 TaxID=2135723 RepID=UPI001E413BE7|nr:SDR family NAD(P)-dependent oxidoreductase [Promicromonospora sp. AC04]
MIGATRGIGAATARGLLTAGYRTAGTHRSGGSVPAGVVGIEMDVRDAGSISSGVKQAVASLGGLDMLVVAAGITRDKLLLRMSEEDLSEVMQVNAIGPMLACKAALGTMVRQRSGSIVLVSSMSVKYGVIGQCNYTASKGALEAFARSMAREYADRNIRVNVVAPGATDTDMMANVSTEARTAMLAGIPLKRLGTAEEMASAIIHTAENTYMSGATIPVAGGI